MHIDPLSVRRELTDRLRMLDCTGIVVSASDLTTFKDAFSDLGHKSCAKFASPQTYVLYSYKIKSSDC